MCRSCLFLWSWQLLLVGGRVSGSSIALSPWRMLTWRTTRSASLRVQGAAGTLCLPIPRQGTSARNLPLNGYFCPPSLRQGGQGRVHNQVRQDTLYLSLSAGKERKSFSCDSQHNCGSSQAPDPCKFVLCPVVRAVGKPNPAAQKWQDESTAYQAGSILPSAGEGCFFGLLWHVALKSSIAKE